MINLSNINKYYSSSEETLHVLNDINLTIESGEFLAIMGPSGSGKSTLINLLGFIDKKYTGDYFFKNQAVGKFSDKELSNIRNKAVGFVFQNFSLIETLSARENVMLPLLYCGLDPKACEHRVKKALEKVGLSGKEEKYPKQLSGGQQQRIAIARAIINNPSFIIADEPTGALDSKTTEEILSLFQYLNQDGVTIILVTHDEETIKYCNRLIKVRDGIIIEEVLV